MPYRIVRKSKVRITATQKRRYSTVFDDEDSWQQNLRGGCIEGVHSGETHTAE